MCKNATILLFLLMNFAAKAQEKNFIDLPYLEVTGSADSLIIPNEIFIRISLNEKNTRDKVPLQEQEAAMYKSLQSIGINTEKELVVHDMASTFKTYLLKGSSVLKSREYILKVGDAATAGKVFVELEKLDISNSNIMAVDHSDMDNIKNKLRSKAVENAKTRASALTKPLGQSVGNAIHITDMERYNGGGPSYATNMRREYAGNSVTQIDGIVVNGPIDIEFTKITVKADVTVKFVLK